MELIEEFGFAAREGQDFWGPGDRYTFLVTGAESGGSMVALECLVGAGGGQPPHERLAARGLPRPGRGPAGSRHAHGAPPTRPTGRPLPVVCDPFSTPAAFFKK